jgi:hypothetical protein
MVDEHTISSSLAYYIRSGLLSPPYQEILSFFKYDLKNWSEKNFPLKKGAKEDHPKDIEVLLQLH